MSNLLPPPQKKIIGRIRSLRYARAVLCMVGICCIVALLLLVPAAHSIRVHYAVANQTLAKYTTEGSLVSGPSIDALAHTLVPISNKLSAPLPPTPADLMSRIEALVPPSIHVSEYAVNDTKTPVIVMTGTATTRAALQVFVDLLDTTAGISQVNSPVENYVKSTNPSFTISVTFSS